MRMDFHSIGVWFLILMLVIGWSGCVQQAKSGAGSPYMDDYFRGDFSVRWIPALNRKVTVIFTVNPIEDSFNTQIYIQLSEGIELIEGDTQWKGDLKKDEIFTMKIVVKPIKRGQLMICSEVFGDLGGAERNWLYCVFFLTYRCWGRVSRTRFHDERPAIKDESKSIPVSLGFRLPYSIYINEEIVLICSLIAEKDIKNVKVVVELPEGLIFIDGTLEWSGALKKEQEKIFQATIKPIKRDRFEILGIITYDMEEVRYVYGFFAHRKKDKTSSEKNKIRVLFDPVIE